MDGVGRRRDRFGSGLTLSRRNLLRLGAAGLLSLACAPVLASKHAADVTADEPDAVPVIVGYAARGGDETEIDLVDAASLRSGNDLFHEAGANLSFRGFCELAGDARFEKLAVDVSFVPFHDAVFHAWSYYDDDGLAPSCSSPVSMMVPIDSRHGLNLTLTVQRRDHHDPVEIPIRLDTGRDSDVPKLREGHYFIAIPRSDDEPVNWHDYVLHSDSNTPWDTRLTRSPASVETLQTSPGPLLMFSVALPGEVG